MPKDVLQPRSEAHSDAIPFGMDIHKWPAGAVPRLLLSISLTAHHVYEQRSVYEGN
jgi:hypothetical protein